MFPLILLFLSFNDKTGHSFLFLLPFIRLSANEDIILADLT